MKIPGNELRDGPRPSPQDQHVRAAFLSETELCLEPYSEVKSRALGQILLDNCPSLLRSNLIISVVKQLLMKDSARCLSLRSNAHSVGHAINNSAPDF